MHPGDRHYRNETLRLTDLAVVQSSIEHVTFETCRLLGPAVLLPLGDTRFDSCRFEADFEAILWEIPDDRTVVIGALALVGCSLIGCSLQGLGLAVPRAQVPRARAGFGL